MASELQCDACGVLASDDNPVGLWSDGIQTCMCCDEVDAEVEALLENGTQIVMTSDGKWYARTTEGGKLVIR